MTKTKLHLKPLKIGSVVLDDPVILAPMAGITDEPFRRLVKSFGVGMVVSEMIASRAMLIQYRKKQKKMDLPFTEEKPLSVQIFGADPNYMAEAAQINQDRGADIIDINMGCPAKKIVKGGGGSQLMQNEDLAGKIIKKVVEAVSIPVTVKMRTGWDEKHKNCVQLAQIARDCGAKMICIHGRTKQQMFTGQSNWDDIKAVKDAVQIPVIGNGDILTVEDAVEKIKSFGVDGIMIGRGIYGRPWLCQQIIHFLRTGEKLNEPCPKEKYEIVIRHFQSILEYYGDDVGVKMARKHLAWYARGLVGAAAFRTQINHITNVREIKTLLKDFYFHDNQNKVE